MADFMFSATCLAMPALTTSSNFNVIDCHPYLDFIDATAASKTPLKIEYRFDKYRIDDNLPSIQITKGNEIGLVLSPLLVGIVIRSYGWTILLGNNGIINKTLMNLGLIDRPVGLMYNVLGIVIALVHVFLPFMILPLMSALQGIDPSLTSAARSLGAGKLTVFTRVILRLAMPGIQAGCILVFVLSFSAYVTPALIGGLRVKTMAVSVVDALIDTFQWPFGSAMALTLSLTGAVIVVIFARLTRMKWKMS